jgi:G3E family GTPase
MTAIPIVLLTGFLGSGKTTLLNALMARRQARGARGRIALVVNELGEVGIDGALLPGQATRQVELAGGCVCCVLNDELDRAILELIATNQADGGLDAIVIETTGVAEPLPIVWALERQPLAAAVRLATIVTLVDATHFPASRALSPAADEQVVHGDVLVLTKAEIAGPEAAEDARRQAVALAPRAPWVDGDTAAVAAWLDDLLADPPARVDADHAHGDHDHDHAAGGLGAAHGIASVWTEVPEVLDLEELLDALEALPAHYIRIKGIARVVDGRTGSDAIRYAAFHRVGLRVSSELIDRPGPTRAVALGAGVEVGPLRACIARAVISSPHGRGDL